MAHRGPLAGVAAFLAVLGVGVVVGATLGVGPLAAAVPPDKVTDPREMIARSLQATIDAKSVHVAASVEGTIPGPLVTRAAGPLDLAGTGAQVDIVPGSASTRATIRSGPLDVTLDTVSIWDAVWYKAGPDGTWTSASLGGTSAEAGLDINPLTLVDRVRGYLARPDLRPTVVDAVCASGAPCRHIVLEAGTAPGEVLATLLPDENAAALPPVRTTLTLDTEIATLRPQRLLLEMRSADGTVNLRLVLETSRWDEPITIEQPLPGS